ncbi:16905_t:CDS:2 [Funneliformis caledonium]|uniref:16905_t:CDS:1 n=1 Tax=Funneliformis caledonium TaxID=1117310 RepID=A0A9N9BV18_9GLOM|nr:16905_t:CDS:2 [Funneliformis caledonium]
MTRFYPFVILSDSDPSNQRRLVIINPLNAFLPLAEGYKSVEGSVIIKNRFQNPSLEKSEKSERSN